MKHHTFTRNGCRIIKGLIKTNKGKIFEEDFKNSVPEYALAYRLPDFAQSFGGGKNNLRFTIKNPFDYLLWDSERHILYALELKTVKGKSISFERSKRDKGEIHFHQIEGLNKWSKYDGIVSGLIIEVREMETTIFIDINSFNKLIGKVKKKSFNYSDLIENEILFRIISQRKKITRYTYDIDAFLRQTLVR